MRRLNMYKIYASSSTKIELALRYILCYYIYIDERDEMDIREFVKKNRNFGWQNASAVRRLSEVHHTIAELEYISCSIARYAKNGKIGIVIDATDCDMARSVYGYVEQAVAYPIYRMMQRTYADAEGPTYIRFCTPQDAQETNYTIRDLALEAFEDGHAHVVYR